MNDEYAEIIIELLKDSNQIEQNRNVILINILNKLDDIQKELKGIRDNQWG